MNEPHELDDLARQAAADVFAEGQPEEVELSYRIARFVTGVSYDGGDARVTVWSIDDQTVIVWSVVVGEDQPMHRVFVPEVDSYDPPWGEQQAQIDWLERDRY